MRYLEPVTRLPRRDHALGRAAGALGIRPVRIEPEPQRHADRVRQRAEECDRAVHAAAHRHCDTSRRGRCAEDGAERVRKRVHREGLAADGRRLEQRQAGDVALETGRVRLDDSVAVHVQPDCGPLAVAAGVSEDLVHAVTVDEELDFPASTIASPACSVQGRRRGLVGEPWVPPRLLGPSYRSEQCDPGLPGGCRAQRSSLRSGRRLPLT